MRRGGRAGWAARPRPRAPAGAGAGAGAAPPAGGDLTHFEYDGVERDTGITRGEAKRGGAGRLTPYGLTGLVVDREVD